ncbi:MAG: tetratricopeptide repeat protein, partial [Clostridia bacterium]|nr:tetratricopeptide repeat protein [Clostridia bacterium]
LKSMLKEMLNGDAEKGVPERKLSRIVTDHGVKEDEIYGKDFFHISSRVAFVALMDNIKDEEWNLIGRCAYDMRSMKHIVEDFRLFAASMLWMNRIPDRSWLPFVIYRNIMHRDFHGAYSGDSVFDAEDKNERREMIYDGIDGSDIYKEDVCELFEMFINNGYLDRKAINRLTTVSDYDMSIDELIDIASSINTETESGKLELAEIYYTMSKLHYPSNLAFALEYGVKSVELRKKTLGEEHRDTALGYIHIASIYSTKGEYDYALKYEKKALAIFEKIHGKDQIIMCYFNIAREYDAMGEYDLALKYYDNFFMADKNVSTVSIYDDKAVMNYNWGYYDRALKYYKKALTAREKRYMWYTPENAVSCNIIAGVYRALREYDLALEYDEKALAIRKMLYRVEPEAAATSYNNIAIVYKDRGNLSTALEYAVKAFNIREKKLGKEHPYTKRTYELLHEIYDKTEFKGGNKPSFEEWLESERKKHSADSGKASEEQ